MVTLIAFVWGLYLRTRREQVVSLRERAERLEALAVGQDTRIPRSPASST